MSSLVPAGSLADVDPELQKMIRQEAERQHRKIIMIASESICPRAVRDALASEFSNIYAEGYPSPRTLLEPATRLSSFRHQLAHYRRYSNRRYYKGCEYVDILESTLRRRTAEVFANDRVPTDAIFVNTQPLSGAAANNAVYNAFVKPGEVVLGPSLTHGGHLTHGSEVNRSGMSFQVVPYTVARSGKLDYDAIAKLAREHRPRLVIGGFSAYPWDVDWERMADLAHEVGAVLLADIAHLAGMVAAGLLNSPVGHADVVSFTTHKTMCGPRGAMLLSTDPETARRVDLGVFPGEQGGPHIQQLAAKAVAMEIAGSDDFRRLQQGVLDNARALADGFVAEGLTLAYGGTNTHMCLIDLRKVETPNGQALTGEIASRILDLCGIVCNKNTIFGDTNAIHPSGLRFGTTWATQRGMGPGHMRRLATLVTRAIGNIHPFTYIGGQLDWGRGKIAQAVIEEVSQGVTELLQQAEATFPAEDATSAYPHFPLAQPDRTDARPTPLASLHKSQAVKMVAKDGWLVPQHFGDPDNEIEALKDGTALVDNGGNLIVEIGLGRPGQLLECACTNEILTMPQRTARSTLMLDQQGALLADALVLRLPVDPEGYDRYWMKVRTDRPDAILQWLRGLSDGYLLHDEDIWCKCEGPAVIEDLAAPCSQREAVTCLGLRGPKAAECVRRAFSLDPPEPGAATESDVGWIVARPAGLVPGFDLFVPVARAAAVWSRLVEAGSQPAGCDAMSRVHDRTGSFSWSGEDRPPQDERVVLSKPFFVGQKALLAKGPRPEPPAPFHWDPPEQPLQETCLIEEHTRLASPKHLVPFAGWKMPVMYSGILDEHDAVRGQAGLFDVAHMGVLEFSGPFAERYLDLVSTNYVPMLAPGQAHYSYLLDHQGRCIDDIIIYRLARERFLVVVNAANAEEDEAWLRAVLDDRLLLDPEHPGAEIRGELTIRNLKDPQWQDACRVDLALQGPATPAILERICDDRSFLLALRHLRKFELASGWLAGLPVIAARTGYTGEDQGFEIFVHPDKAPVLWNAILDEGRALGCVPAGLGARDSLRTEAGYPLHGHELAGPHAISPIEAGYGGYVKLHKPFFPGRRRMLAGHQNRERSVVRFEVDEKGGKVLRAGNPVLAGRKGKYVGVVTSCTATRQRQIGLALIDARHAREGAKLHILPVTGDDKAPPPRAPQELEPGDWMVIPRRATILPRFMKPGEQPLPGC